MQHIFSIAQRAMRRLRYRVQQFRAAVNAQVSASERASAYRLLAPGEQALFEAMSRYDQRHCLDVFHTLQQAGYNDAILLRAALIHDCGKVDDDGRPTALGWYVLATLLRRAPSLFRLAATNDWPWLRPLRVYAEHEQRGARMAAAAGSPTELVKILRFSADHDVYANVLLLQWADDQN